MKKVKDGWHVLLGYRVWVEKNRVKYADAGKYDYGYLYRRIGGNGCHWKKQACNYRMGLWGAK